MNMRGDVGLNQVARRRVKKIRGGPATSSIHSDHCRRPRAQHEGVSAAPDRRAGDGHPARALPCDCGRAQRIPRPPGRAGASDRGQERSASAARSRSRLLRGKGKPKGAECDPVCGEGVEAQLGSDAERERERETRWLAVLCSRLFFPLPLSLALQPLRLKAKVTPARLRCILPWRLMLGRDTPPLVKPRPFFLLSR